MRHVVIGTAGHVDHGKTALVHALTGVYTDRLPEEQRRGITIELGFAPWQLADDLLVSVIDAPGHRKLVHHMIAGASGIDIVLLVVAADEGVMPQTREHMAACKLLGVKRAVVAITKLDRVDEELAELAAEEARELCNDHGIEATAVLCSAKENIGIEAVREAMRATIAATQPETRDRRVRLSIDRVFSVKGAGTVVTGTLVEGALEVGSPLRILGPERELGASARRLQVHGETRDRVMAPTRLALNLSGVARQDLDRGDVLTDDGHALPTRVLDVWLQALEPLKRGAEAAIFVGTARSVARIQPVAKADTLVEGGLARLRLKAPLVALGGDRFVLRGSRVDGPSGAVIGGGVVLDAQPPKRVRAAKREALLAALHAEDADQAAVALIAEAAPRPLPATALPSRFSLGAERLRAAAEASDAVATATGWLSRGAFDGARADAVALVKSHHAAHPLDPGLPLQTLREQLGAYGDGAKVVLDALTKSGELVVEADSVRTKAFAGAQGKAAELLERARKLLVEAALAGMSEHAMGDALGEPKQVAAVMAALGRDGRVVKTGGLWFDSAVVTSLASRVTAHLHQHGKLEIADFKDMTGLGRKQAIPLLEHFDREQLTKRDGSTRLPGAKLPPAGA